MNLWPEETIVKQGTFLYDGVTECDVRIVHSGILYGSGDYEDPVEIRDDQELDTYYVWYGSTSRRGEYVSRHGAYSTLSEAILGAESAEGIGPTVRWTD